MPLRGQKPRRWTPAGLTDTVDGSESFPGAMAQLSNLIAQPNTKGIMVPRPAMTQLTAIPDFASGPVTAEVSYGNTFYGMAASFAFSGKDRPFLYNATTNAFTTISGLSSALLPASQPTTGDWTPPTIAYVASRVVFTHPGFPGGSTMPPGFFQFPANTTNNSNIIQVPAILPNFAGFNGDTIVGAGIPASTTVTNLQPVIVYVLTTSGTAGASTFVVTSAAGLFVGMSAIGPGVFGVVTAIAGTTITINTTLGQNLGGTQQVSFFGGNATLSANATATANSVIMSVWSTSAIKFGWLDVSGFTASIVGNTVNSTPGITGVSNLVGIQPGMTISGTGIPASTTVLQSNIASFAIYCSVTAAVSVVNLLSTLGTTALAVGMTVSGVGIPLNTTVAAVNLAGLTVTLSTAPTTTSAATQLTFVGNFIVMSANATSTNQQEAITIAGGTAAAPLWGAGDLNVNPIGSSTPPVFVAQFNNRAWFGVNTPQTAGVQASDSGGACVQTTISQTLTFFDGVPVTAASGLALFNQLGGIVQSLMVFQGGSNIRQITGDFSSANISVNSLQTATGTLAPNSIEQTPKGLLFMAPDGLRLIDFDARVSDPIGVRGHGIVLPFINAVTPSRAEASFNENIYRITVIWQPPITVQSVWGTAQRTDEFWYHLDLDKWSGPHTSLCDNLAPWPGAASFVTAPNAARGFLYRSDPAPSTSSIYLEFGKPLTCAAQTVLLPDNSEGIAHSVIESTVFIGLVSGSEEILVTATDDAGQVIDQAYVWIGQFSVPAQRMILWHKPLIFRQMSLLFQMGATAALQLGTIMIRGQELGYQIAYPVPTELILGQGILGGPDVLGP